MSNIAISFDNVGKMYRLGRVGTGTLSHDLNRWWTTTILRKEDPFLKIGEINDRSKKGSSEYVWALRDISFKVEQGDVVGIIGKNGAGKSTLLKLLSRITSPTTGSIRYQGRIASLLEVGTGFHPEMTGRENIYMNGSIMGMTKKEITRKLDEIVDFAGVERYIDTPVKRYSSGMTVRLGFAVAAFLEPEILVVDEVLTVGDAEFQKKAIGKMNDVAKTGGRTVLFVSHNMTAVKNLCTNGIVLNNGQLVFNGGVNEAVDFYLTDGIKSENRDIVENVVWKKDYLTINKIVFNNSTYSETTIYSNQEFLDVVIEGSTTLEMKADIKVTFRSLSGNPLMTLAEGHYKGLVENIDVGSFKMKKRIKLPKYLSTGDYFVDIFLHQPYTCWYMKAPSCVFVHIDGGIEEYGQSLVGRFDGFCGFETVDIDEKI